MSSAAIWIDETGQPRDGAPFGALLTAQAEARPDAPALSFAGSTMTFAQIEAAANRMARYLADVAYVSQGDRVGIHLPNGPDYFVVTHAIWKLGAIPCPVSARMAEAEFQTLVQLAAPRIIFGTAQTPIADALLVQNDGDLHSYSSEALPHVITAPCKIMNSGGSTGRPKLIIDPEPCAWGPDKEGRRRPARTTLLMPAPMHHSAPFSYSTMAMLQGSHIVLMDHFDPLGWLDMVERYRACFCYVVPTMMSRIAKLSVEVTDAADLTSIETLIHMAAPCPVDVKRWWIVRIGAKQVLEIYGGTERIGATVIDGEQWLARPGSVGRAVSGDEIVILGDDGLQLPSGEIGEIYFRKTVGPGKAYAYIGSHTRISGDLDSFGDMGWVDKDGFLYIADRRTDMVTIGGANVFPAEIEAVLESLPYVLCAAVIGLPDKDMGNRLHAIIEIADDCPLPQDAMAFVAPALAKISPLKHPKSIEFTNNRIRDDAGKVRRSQLRQERIRLMAE